MERWKRRIRGTIGMGLIWGFAWFLAGMVLLLIVGPDAADVPFPLGFGALGFLGGTTFSVVVGIVGRRRRFDEISLPQFAGWGAVGGLAFSGIFAGVAALFGSPEPFQTLPLLAPLFSVAGAGCAAGALALARRAEASGRLEGGVEVDEVGLTERERRELLGGGHSGRP